MNWLDNETSEFLICLSRKTLETIRNELFKEYYAQDETSDYTRQCLFYRWAIEDILEQK